MPKTPDPGPTPVFTTPDGSWAEWAMDVPNDTRAIPLCRRTVRTLLTLHGLIGLVDTAELLTTELMSNAVQHTTGPASMGLDLEIGLVRIGVWDTDPQPPTLIRDLTDPVEAEDGRGLALVRFCAESWGWNPRTRNGKRGKYVWFELRTG